MMKSSKFRVVNISADERARCRQVLNGATKRELDVLYALANGLSVKQVAVLLEITTKTVEMHITSLRELCHKEWDLPLDKRLPNRFLNAKFAVFFQLYETQNAQYIQNEGKISF